MRVSSRSRFGWAVSAAVVGALGFVSQVADAGGNVPVLVLKEHAVGSSAQAQPYLDKLLGATAQQNGWASASGKFFTARSGADAYIQSDKPKFGIISIAAFLAFRGTYNLEVIGQAQVKDGGGQQYFLISKNQGDLAGCKGKTLASDHADDTRFIDKIIFAGQAKLGDFTLDKTTRPLQTVKKVVDGGAECALIDDAQLTEAKKMDPGIKVAWSSAKLPAMPIVAFPAANAAEKAGFKGNLPKICTGANQQTCADIGLQSLNAAGNGDYSTVVSAY